MVFNQTCLDDAKKDCAESDVKSKATAALYLVGAERQNPGIATDLIVDYLRFTGREGQPAFDLTPNFYYPMMAATVAMAKQTPSVWQKLTEEDVERLDLLMKCMAALCAIGTDDGCTYTTGPGLIGNYCKSWNPNYPISNIPQILFASSYFGSADAVNEIIRQFDYDAYVEQFRKFDWNNTLGSWVRPVLDDNTIEYQTATEGILKEKWKAKILTDDGEGHYTLEVVTSSEDIRAKEYGKLDVEMEEGKARTIKYTSPKAMMMNGGDVFAMKALYRISQYVGAPRGTGIGIPEIGKKGYFYKGMPLSDAEGIWNSLLNYNYSGGIVASEEVPDENGVCQCYIYDRVPSPVEGFEGMMKEFRSGKRSSVSYTSVDYIMCVCVTFALTELGMYHPMSDENLPLMKKIWVGNVDFLHKADHGYVSYTGTAVRGNPKPVFGSTKGGMYSVWKAYWEENEKPRFTKEDM